MSRQTDLELCSKVAEGDHAAFNELLGNLRTAIRGRVVRAVGCPDVAEDITQQTIMNAYLKIDKFRGESTFSTWVYSIATNCLLMHFRSEARVARKKKRISDSDYYEMIDNQTPLNGAELNEVCHMIRTALGQLPNKYRVVIELWISGMALLDISEYLGLTRTAVKSQLHRARRYMKTYILEKYGKPALKEIF